MNGVHSHEDTTKLVDIVYKNILDKFNPNTRQLIQSGKGYLKSLHAMAEASRSYRESMAKFAREAQFGVCGASSDIGTAMLDTVNVLEAIHTHEKQIMKSFYVDFILPLESNIEKDTKLIQNDQKRFLQEHKVRQENYQKAFNAVRKDKKKAKGSKTVNSLEKELKHLQNLEDERSKFDSFCHSSLQNAVKQERRRYGFVLERQCSMAKQYLTFHEESSRLLGDKMDYWQGVAKSRDDLTESVDQILSKSYDKNLDGRMKMSKSFSQFSPAGAEVELNFKSVDSSYLDLSSNSGREGSGRFRKLSSRTRSQYDLSDRDGLGKDVENQPPMLSKPPHSRDSATKTIGKALYTYLGHGDRQLTFYEGDTLKLIGEKKKGWQYGENLRTEKFGWFPETYVEPAKGLKDGSISGSTVNGPNDDVEIDEPSSRNTTHGIHKDHIYKDDFPDPDTSLSQKEVLSTPSFHQELKAKVHSFMTLPVSSSRKPPPPPPLPPPMKNKFSVTGMEKSVPQSAPNRLLTVIPKKDPSLHSSNDSGFGNDVHHGPPPLPEADYSDEDEFAASHPVPLPALPVTPENSLSQPPTRPKKRLLRSTSLFAHKRSLPRRKSDPHNSPPHQQANKPQDHPSPLLKRVKDKKPRKPVTRSTSLLVTVSRLWKKESEYSTIDDLIKPKAGFLRAKIMGKREDMSVVCAREPVREEEVENVNLPRIRKLEGYPYHPRDHYDKTKALDAVTEEDKTATFQSHYRLMAPSRPRCLSESDIADTDALLLLLESPGSRKSYDDDFLVPCSAHHPPDIFDYGSNLEKRLKTPERGSRLDSVSLSGGKMYGPWYDLWGQDLSVALSV